MGEPGFLATSDPSGAPAVRLIGLRKEFGSVVAVDDVDLDIADGEFFALLGPSGSGKTTCLRLIAGFEKPTRGHIELHGQDVSRRPPFDRDVNTVFQDYALFPHMTVVQNIAYGLRVKKVGRQEIATRVDEALHMVRLSGLEARKPAQLSGGQRQRVALARALVNRPRVLLLDEPLGALDLKLRHQMQLELKRIQREVGITFVFVTHDQEEALTMSDRLAVFSHGRIEQIGEPSEVYERPITTFVAGFLGSSNLISGDLATRLSGSPRPLNLRPERIRIASPDEPVPAGHHVLDGTVRDIVFLGGFTRYLVSVTPHDDLIVIEQNAHGAARSLPATERSVRLTFSPDALQAVASDESQATTADMEGAPT